MTEMPDSSEIKGLFSQKQKEKLYDVLKYVQEYNAFYRDIFLQNNINLEDDVEVSFQKIPIITKKDIRDNYLRFISRTKGVPMEEMTSGSTGVPVKCLKTKSERMMASMNIWKQRQTWDAGVNVDNYISLHDLKTYKTMGNFFDFDRENMKNCFERMLAVAPRWVSGPASAFERYGRLIEQGIIPYSGTPIKYIELMGEYANKRQRDYIEDIYKCKTINHYGTIESWCIAYECPNGSMHVQEDLIFAETVNKGRFDLGRDIGEITITSLYNKAMPLLRYNLQDLGVVEHSACGCGKSTQIVKLFGGRTGDMISGKKEIHGEMFFKRGIYKLINKGMDCIESFKAEQTALDKFILYIVRKDSYTGDATEYLLNYIHKGLGEDADVEFRFVDAIPPLPSGKIKIFHTFVK